MSLYRYAHVQKEHASLLCLLHGIRKPDLGGLTVITAAVTLALDGEVFLYTSLGLLASRLYPWNDLHPVRCGSGPQWRRPVPQRRNDFSPVVVGQFPERELRQAECGLDELGVRSPS